MHEGIDLVDKTCSAKSSLSSILNGNIYNEKKDKSVLKEPETCFQSIKY